MTRKGQAENFAERFPDLSYRFWFRDGLPSRQAVADALKAIEWSQGALAIKCEGLDFVFAADDGENGEKAAQLFGLALGDIEDAAIASLTILHRGKDDCFPIESVRIASRLALRISDLPGCVAVGWHTAASVMEVGYFRSVIDKWLAGGPFPALGLVSLISNPDGSLSSRGLAVFAGQELIVPAEAALSKVERAQAAIRMIDHLAGAGPVEAWGTIEIAGFGCFKIEPDSQRKNIYLTRSPFP